MRESRLVSNYVKSDRFGDCLPFRIKVYGNIIYPMETNLHGKTTSSASVRLNRWLVYVSNLNLNLGFYNP
ncbi:MAG: hypothetical protein HC860_12550 [Alkalinema sp. RU_4_3]|nr:hypothetical protein [Alkalinema sp. RU_4_3]